MDLNQITDVKELKSMAFDQLAAKEIAEKNLQSILQRIGQVEQEDQAKEDTKK